MLGDRLKRALGPAIIALLGLLLLVPTLGYLPTAASVPELAVAGLGSLVSLVLVGAGAALLWRGVAPVFALRVAGWAVLGTVVLGTVLGLITLSGVVIPVYAAATLLAVSTFAHVLIGVRDVQRIRAEDLARQREKLAVLTRLLRHNLRHEAQRLIYAGTVLAESPDADVRRVGDDVETVAEHLSAMNERLDRSQTLIRGGSEDTQTVDLGAHVREVASEYRDRYPAAEIEVDVPADCWATGGEDVRQAVVELVDNALAHAGEAPRVTIAVDTDGDTTTVTVADDGPGIPEPDRSVITRETEITQLHHSQGLGLWFVRWVMDAYRGRFQLDTTGEGTTVRVHVPTA